MTSQNNVPDPNGGEAVMPGEDIGNLLVICTRVDSLIL